MKIIYISGGQRSGKSEWAEKLALQLSDRPLFIATSRIWDEQHASRIAEHRQRRSAQWQTLEEETQLSSIKLEGKTALLDCITLWITNLFDDAHYHGQTALEAAIAEWNKFIQQEGTLLVVSNELGMGLHPLEKGGRDFVDLHGKINQHIATRADEAWFLVSGNALRVK